MGVVSKLWSAADQRSDDDETRGPLSASSATPTLHLQHTRPYLFPSPCPSLFQASAHTAHCLYATSTTFFLSAVAATHCSVATISRLTHTPVLYLRLTRYLSENTARRTSRSGSVARQASAQSRAWRRLSRSPERVARRRAVGRGHFASGAGSRSVPRTCS